jgi:hypothetical protein
LAGLQRFLTDAVRGVSPIGAEGDLARSMEALIVQSVRGMGAAEQVEVYREQFWLRHLPSLRDDYPTLVWALGDEAFRRLSVEYLCACPPNTWNLQLLGAGIAAHVAGHSPWCVDPILCDAAHLDQAFMEAFDAPDAPPFDPRLLAATSEGAWPEAHVLFHPSLRAIELAHPLHSVRDALKRGRPCERPRPEPTHVVVWRDAKCFRLAASVEPLAFRLLAALHAGAPLGEACGRVTNAQVGADSADLGARVGAWFQQWTASGWVSAVRFP